MLGANIHVLLLNIHWTMTISQGSFRFGQQILVYLKKKRIVKLFNTVLREAIQNAGKAENLILCVYIILC